MRVAACAGGARWARWRRSPGIVLTAPSGAGGRWRFAGLRDPLARDPAAVLAGAGRRTPSVEQRWEPYLPLEPAMVLARARRASRRPPSVALRWPATPSAARLGGARRGSRAPRGGPALPGRVGAGPERRDARDRRPAWPSWAPRSRRGAMLFGVGSAVLDGRREAGSPGGGVAPPAATRGVGAIGARRDDRAGRPHRSDRLRRRQPGTQPGAGRGGASPRWRRAACPPAPPGRVPSAPAARCLRDSPAERARLNRSVSFGIVGAASGAMIQKKVCMVGVFGTGKTSLVQRFVHSIFSERYLRPSGVKIDRKAVAAGRRRRHAGALGPGGPGRAETSPPATSGAPTPSSTSSTARGARPATSFPSFGRWCARRRARSPTVRGAQQERPEGAVGAHRAATSRPSAKSVRPGADQRQDRRRGRGDVRGSAGRRSPPRRPRS